MDFVARVSFGPTSIGAARWGKVGCYLGAIGYGKYQLCGKGKVGRDGDEYAGVELGIVGPGGEWYGKVRYGKHISS